MNGAFIHLLFNHIPVIGVPLSWLLLTAGAFRHSRELIQAAYVSFILMALLTIPAFKSGGPAVHVVRDLPGISRPVIRAHAQAADKAFWGVELLGLAGLIGVWFSKRADGVPPGVTVLTLLFGLGASVWLGWVAHLGGLIRHPEIAPDFIRGVSSVESPQSPPVVPAVQ